ncbi:hypothetical protein [Aquirufa ecclesiirivi]|uniref:hypothetical protein n=1 Tax=Aquirufa ecclesiirivi TaxID=2715124 RepID=UPI00140ABC9C|nr:hypothetical protein [Aquirufa ecclesiirivi]NHC47714.1 hypothetical protein [Aquirufa ecclesiirivi]
MENLLSFRWTSWYVNIFIVMTSLVIPIVDYIKTWDWIPFTYFIVDTRYVLVGLIILVLYLLFSMFIDQSRYPLLFEESRLATLAVILYGIFLWIERPFGLEGVGLVSFGK